MGLNLPFKSYKRGCSWAAGWRTRAWAGGAAGRRGLSDSGTRRLVGWLPDWLGHCAVRQGRQGENLTAREEDLPRLPGVGVGWAGKPWTTWDRDPGGPLRAGALSEPGGGLPLLRGQGEPGHACATNGGRLKRRAGMAANAGDGAGGDWAAARRRQLDLPRARPGWARRRGRVNLREATTETYWAR